MNLDPSKIYIKSKSKNYIVTIAIGKKYLNQWKLFAYNNWKSYCLKNDIGLMVITSDLINKKDKHWKKATWQKMLIGKHILSKNININNVCYLDTDYLINPNSPNVFKYQKANKISVVSAIKNLPYPLDFTRKKIAFNRKYYFDKKYPLDSALFVTSKNYYNFHNFKDQKDIINMGFFVFNVKKFSKMMNNWFLKYDSKIKGLTNGGDNPFISYEILNTKKVKWLDYKFNTLWNYEIGFKYSFLYANINNKKLSRLCVEDSLSDCYFLHFAGSWHESRLWQNEKIFNSSKKIKLNQKFHNYFKKNLSGKPKGKIIPKD